MGLLTDPGTGLPVAGVSRSFMRAGPQFTDVGPRTDGPVRVLLVILRVGRQSAGSASCRGGPL